MNYGFFSDLALKVAWRTGFPVSFLQSAPGGSRRETPQGFHEIPSIIYAKPPSQGRRCSPLLVSGSGWRGCFGRLRYSIGEHEDGLTELGARSLTARTDLDFMAPTSG